MTALSWDDLLNASELVGEDEAHMLAFSSDLRRAADRYPFVVITMTREQARRVANDIEELALLHAAPPTGDEG